MAIGKRPCPKCKGPMHRGYDRCGNCRNARIAAIGSTGSSSIEDQIVAAIRNASKHGGITAEQIGVTLDLKTKSVCEYLFMLQHQGRAIYQFGDRWFTDVVQTGEVFDQPLLSDKDGWHTFGAIGDTHMGSKLERLEELRDIYRIFEANGVRTVLHTGNYIDGESRFNRHELKIHGMDAQLAYMGEQYPQVKGITTYLVSGDDHEGWYAQREGVNIGFYMQSVMERGGRSDLKSLGYMESFVPLAHPKCQTPAMVHVVHPGGGSAYAVSYTMQKQIEAYEGGEKPAIVLAGHYHKAEFLPSRNVFGFQTGCFQDQTTFMRKKKLVAVIGGWLIRARQNPATGAIEEVHQYFKQYFNRGYYVNNRWSLSGPVSLVPRIKL